MGRGRCTFSVPGKVVTTTNWHRVQPLHLPVSFLWCATALNQTNHIKKILSLDLTCFYSRAKAANKGNGEELLTSME